MEGLAAEEVTPGAGRFRGGPQAVPAGTGPLAARRLRHSGGERDRGSVGERDRGSVGERVPLGAAA
ncbi:hypothetical protein GCM10010381_30440 [Streptomyces xantholiticus]|nr:hypothetical protein GCM10010381_30440 [Streptomyces xantholiticus]